METTYTGRCDHRRFRHAGGDEFAQVTVRVRLCDRSSDIVLSPDVLDYLCEVFGEDFEHHRHCGWGAVVRIRDGADRYARETLPQPAWFHVEVVGVRVSGYGDHCLYEALLTTAGEDALEAYIDDW